MMRYLMLVAVLSVGCKKKALVLDEPTPYEPTPYEPQVAPEPEVPEPVKQIVRNFSRVQFDYDSAGLSDYSLRLLGANAEIMQAFPAIRVEVQGHADERGTTDYNLALGERRAQAVKDALAGMGVAGSRLTAISYGEERPIITESSESAWSVNRRAEFRVIAGGGPEVEGTVD